ncbi:hypothetical protein FRB97_004846 [Tulasnella sp. 331]|nr:hypothetical protein FRB97_004846 [Tulasnella sp. 331]KAG8880996.1 hypothetical protein FRB98_004603 [Tulasnella sp. 332]
MRKYSVIAIAATLVTSVHSLGTSCTAALTPAAVAGQPSWMQTITRRGSSAYNTNPGVATYKPYRSVKDYGAKGDGVTDDTAAINAAIADQNRCGEGCNSSTLSPAIIFFPIGNYLVSGSIIPYYFTQLVGDATNPPTITAASSFTGYLIDADPYIPGGNGAQWWVNQNNFFKSIRHLKLDISKTSVTSGATALHWQVAQATTLVDVVVNMSTDPSTTQVGMFMENGSGGFMSDLIFNGGKYGLNVGNQQFTVRNLTVNNAQTAVFANWGWGWTYQGVNINNCGVGFNIQEGGINTAHQTVGSEVIIDAVVTNTPTFILTSNSYNGTFAGSLVLDNIQFSGVTTGVKDSSGATKLAGGTTTVRQWVQGNTYSGTGTTPAYQQANIASPATKPTQLLTSAGKIYSRGRTDYPNYAASQFASVKAAGAKGDGVTDDTAAIQAFINANWGCKILFFDAGTYYVTSTITLPTGSIAVGEVWTTIIGGGANFANAASPLPVFKGKFGNAGEKGATEISDMVFSARSGSAGAIVVEWNTADTAGKQATAAAWDIHVRLGGFTGSGMQVGNCKALSSPSTTACTAAFMGLHITSQATAYLEGTWVWTADHDLDDVNQSQIDVYTGRGIVTESAAGPVWLIGTASEHASIVQYNFVNTQNVYAGFIQTETAYYQPNPASPAPFTLSTTYNDPTLTAGTFGWGSVVGGTSNFVFIYGGGHYNFFNNYDQTCLTTNNCQTSIVKVASTATNIYYYGLSTVGSTYMLSVDSTNVIAASANVNGFQDSFTYWKSSSTGGGQNSVTVSSTSATTTAKTSTTATSSTAATTTTTTGAAGTCSGVAYSSSTS